MKNKYINQIFFALFLLALVAILVYLLYPRIEAPQKIEEEKEEEKVKAEIKGDFWYCENSEWKKWGEPKKPKPPTKCFFANTLEENGKGLYLDSLSTGDEIKNPVRLAGRITVDWFEGGKFLIYVKDQNGEKLGYKEISLDKKFENKNILIDFKEEINYKKPTTSAGTLVFVKGNAGKERSLADFKRFMITFNEYEN